MTGKLIWCHFVEANKDRQTMLQATGEIAHDLCQGLKVDQMTQATHPNWLDKRATLLRKQTLSNWG